MTARDILKILQQFPKEALDQDVTVQTTEGDWHIKDLTSYTVDYGQGDIDTIVYISVIERGE